MGKRVDSRENVRQWFLNDEGLYQLARASVRRASNKDEAARKILEQLPEKTPCGLSAYTLSNVRYALRSF